MNYSILYQAASAPTVLDRTGATIIDATQFAIGGTWYHGQPGTNVPASASPVLRDGSTAWTWNAIAVELTAPERAVIRPHRWDDELTDAALDVSQWPLLQSPPLN